MRRHGGRYSRCRAALRALFRRQYRAFASGANESARHGAGMFAALEDRRTGDHRRFIALDALHETPAIGGHVVDESGLAHVEIVEVDDVDVGAQPRRQPAAIGKAEEVGGLAGLALNQMLEWLPRSAV